MMLRTLILMLLTGLAATSYAQNSLTSYFAEDISELVDHLNKSMATTDTEPLKIGSKEQLDSFILQKVFVGTTNLINDEKETFEYNADGNLTKYDKFIWHNPGYWRIDFRWEHQYDTNGNLIETVYSSNFNTLELKYKHEYVIVNNLIAEIIEYEYVNNNWKFDRKTTITYNGLGLKMEEIQYSYSNNQWEKRIQFIYQYNTLSDPIHKLENSYYYNQWNYVRHTEWVYDSLDREVLNTIYGEINGFLNAQHKTETTYTDTTTQHLETLFYPAYGWAFLLMKEWYSSLDGTLDTYSETHFSGTPYREELYLDSLSNIIDRIMHDGPPGHRIFTTYKNTMPHSDLILPDFHPYSDYFFNHQRVVDSIWLIDTVLTFDGVKTYYWSGIPTSVEELPTTLPITVYPNPTNSILHFDLPPSFEPAIVELFNSCGQVVKRHTIQDNRIEVADLPGGFYCFLIRQGAIQFSGKVIVGDSP